MQNANSVFSLAMYGKKRKCACMWGRPLYFSDLKTNVFLVWISFTLESVSGVLLCVWFGRHCFLSSAFILKMNTLCLLCKIEASLT